MRDGRHGGGVLGAYSLKGALGRGCVAKLSAWTEQASNECLQSCGEDSKAGSASGARLHDRVCSLHSLNYTAVHTVVKPLSISTTVHVQCGDSQNIWISGSACSVDAHEG